MAFTLTIVVALAAMAAYSTNWLTAEDAFGLSIVIPCTYVGLFALKALAPKHVFTDVKSIPAEAFSLFSMKSYFMESVVFLGCVGALLIGFTLYKLYHVLMEIR